MDQITGIPRSNDDGALAWRFAHERLSQMLMEKVDSFYHLAPIMKLDGVGTRSPWLPHYVPSFIPMIESEPRRF